MTIKMSKVGMSKWMTEELDDSDGNYSTEALEQTYMENFPEDDRFALIAEVAGQICNFLNGTKALPLRWQYTQAKRKRR